MMVLSLGALALGACDDDTSNGDGDRGGEPSLAPGDGNAVCLGLEMEECEAHPRCFAVFGKASEADRPRTPEERLIETDRYRFMFCYPSDCSYGAMISCMMPADESICLQVDNVFWSDGCIPDLEGSVFGEWSFAQCGEGICPDPF